MRKLVWAAPLVLIPSVLLAEAPTYDGFDHAVGDALGKHDTYPGKTAPTGQTWRAGGIYNTISTLDAMIDPDALCVPGLAASAGHSVRFLGIGGAGGSNGVVDRIRIGDLTTEGRPQVFTSGEVYFSLILRVVAMTDPGDPTLPVNLNGGFIAGFNNRDPEEVYPPGEGPPGTTRAGTRLHVAMHDIDSTKFRIGVRPDQSAAPVVFDPRPRTPGPDSEPVFIVGRYTFIEGATNNDLHQIWVNPPPATFGAAVAPTYTEEGIDFPRTATGMDINYASDNTGGPPAIYCFFLRQIDISPYSMIVDEVRVGLTWADVTPPGPIVLGPCCAPDGTCSETVQCACNGTWENPGLTCNDVQCPVVLGPCCAPNGSCTETTQSACTGTWENPGLTCTDVQCPCTPDPVFDSDCDGDVDLNDYGRFQTCYGQPATTTGCGGFDADASGTIDGPDFGAFTICATRDGVPADPGCDG